MAKRTILAAAAIFAVWAVCDVAAHHVLLAPFYTADTCLWRPPDQMDPLLITLVKLVLIGFFLATYGMLIRPKSLWAGIVFGSLAGLALGAASGFGTFVHSPIPLGLAWGWFVLGWLKAVAAGGIAGWLIRETGAIA